MTPRHRHVAVFVGLTVTLILWFRTPEWLLIPPFRFLGTPRTAHPDILNRTLGFQHIFAINLPSRTDRRDAMTIAAALSDLEVIWIDGVAGKDVPEKVLPGHPDSRQGGFTVGNKGSWRAHMDVLQRIVRENITSALILEDDADWDVRLKAQMQIFARAARAFTQPRHGQTLAERYRNTHHPELLISRLPRSITDHRSPSPYGTDWDALWLGHCGTEFPTITTTTTRTEPTTSNAHFPPPLRVTIPEDMTVPAPDHLKPHPFAFPDALASQYPPHTRVVHASRGTVCTQAYAVSQQGARKLLWRFGLLTLSGGWDLMLRDWCDGVFHPSTGDATAAGEAASPWSAEDEKGRERGRGRGRKRGPTCVTVQPPLFSHFYGKGNGAASDIMAPGGGFVNRQREMTPYVRVSVRLNMGRLVEGEEGVEQWDEEGVEQWDDGG